MFFSRGKIKLSRLHFNNFGAANFLKKLSTFYIDPEKAHTVDGWLNFDKIDALSYHGTNPNGIGVSQATEANQPLMSINPLYASAGFTSSDEDSFSLTGKGWLLEPAATNLVDNSGLVVSSGTSFTNWTDVTTGGERVVSSTDIDGANSVNISVSAERNLIRQDFTIGATEKRTLHVVLSDVVGSTDAQQVIGGVALPAGATLTYPPCEANPAGGASGTVQAGLLVCIVETTGTSGTFQLRIGFGVIANQTGSATFKFPQHEAGGVPSIFILTPVGSTAVRAADNGYTNTNAAYVDIDPDFTGSAGNISLVGSKYEGLGAAEWVGAIYYNTDGTTSECTAFVGVDTLTWDADINAGGKLVFTRSAYKDDPAAMELLRDNVGDGAIWTSMSTSNFRRRFEFIPKASSGDFSTDRMLYSSYTDANNDLELKVLSGGDVSFTTANAATSSTVTNTTTALVAGERTVIDMYFSTVADAGGSSMYVNGDKDTFTLNAELYYNSTLGFCGGGDSTLEGFPIEICRITDFDASGNIIFDKVWDVAV